MSEVTAVPLPPSPRRMLVVLWVGIAALILAGVTVAWCGTKSAITAALSPTEYLAANGRKSGVVTTASGLQYKVLKQGNGRQPGPNDITKVDYEGRLARTGKTFDSSAKSGGPATLPVSGLIPGWVEGIQLMHEGAKYRFWIPPELGYGPQGTQGGEIPPDAVLIFDVELHEVAALPPGMGGLGMGAPHGDMPTGGQ